MRKATLKGSRFFRSLGFVLADTVVIALSLWLAFMVRFDGAIPPRYVDMLRLVLPMALGVKLLALFIFRAYRFSWAFAGLEDLLNIVLACGAGSLALGALLFLLHNWAPLTGFPRLILIIDFAFTLLGIGGVRFSRRTATYLFSQRWGDQKKKRTLIVGAGEAGEQLVRSLKREERAGFWPIGFVDDDPGKRGLLIHGVPVLGPRSHLPELIRRKGVEAVIIAMPSAPSRIIRETVELAREGGVKEIKIVPFLSEIYTGKVRATDLREVQPEDILPREPATVNLEMVARFLKGKRVLVTGAAGSIGSELCRQILRFAPKELLALDFDETGLFLLERRISRLLPKPPIKVLLADIRDRAKVAAIFKQETPELVFHAAAYKHVPMMEAYPEEAVKTNIFGTLIVCEEACRSGVERFVLISTDKAVNPVSVMGMSKRVAEMITISLGKQWPTKCVVVRFGNVLGSRGSVIPIFLEQIRQGGPVTVTHPDMERYFMTTSEAVLLVLQAAAMGQGGEVFVLDMGKPVKILDIAKELIRFHGLEPDKDIPIVFVGIRPGEKLKEEILTAEEGTEATKHKQIFVAKMSVRLTGDELAGYLRRLEELAARGAGDKEIKSVLKQMIFGQELAESSDKGAEG